METKAAYEAIQRTLSADARKSVVHSSYDEEMFGNFVIAFLDDGRPSSLVNDRGQLLLYDGLDAEEYRRTLLDDLYGADEARVVQAVTA
jgi:hypothetical protein